jgi:hypothetical protein
MTIAVRLGLFSFVSSLGLILCRACNAGKQQGSNVPAVMNYFYHIVIFSFFFMVLKITLAFVPHVFFLWVVAGLKQCEMDLI